MSDKRELRQILKAIRGKAWDGNSSGGHVRRMFNWFSNPPAVGILNLLTMLGVGVALAAYLSDLSNQRESRAFNAWQLLAMDVNGGFGRREALEYLNTQDCTFGPAGVVTEWLFNKGFFEYTQRCALGFPGRTYHFAERSSHIAIGGISLLGSEKEGGAFLDDLRLTNALIHTSHWSFAQLTTSNIRESIIDNWELDYGTLIYAQLERNWVQNSTFDCTDIYAASFKESEFVDTKFRGTHGFEPTFEGAVFRSVGFDGATLERPSFKGASFDEVTYSDSLIYGAEFINIEISQALQFNGGSVAGSRFSASRLSDEATISFVGTDLSDVEIDGTAFQGHLAIEGAWYCSGRPPKLPRDLDLSLLEAKDCSATDFSKEVDDHRLKFCPLKPKVIATWR